MKGVENCVLDSPFVSGRFNPLVHQKDALRIIARSIPVFVAFEDRVSDRQAFVHLVRRRNLNLKSIWEAWHRVDLCLVCKKAEADHDKSFKQGLLPVPARVASRWFQF